MRWAVPLIGSGLQANGVKALTALRSVRGCKVRASAPEDTEPGMIRFIGILLFLKSMCTLTRLMSSPATFATECGPDQKSLKRIGMCTVRLWF